MSGILAAAGLMASGFSACVIAPCTGNNCGFGGGGGGTAASSTSTSVSSSATSSASTSVSSSASGGACDPKATCQGAITPGVDDPTRLCAGAEKDAYDALHKCECDAAGKCAAACAKVDPACAGKPMMPDTACGNCLTDNAAGCGVEFTTCNM